MLDIDILFGYAQRAYLTSASRDAICLTRDRRLAIEFVAGSPDQGCSRTLPWRGSLLIEVLGWSNTHPDDIHNFHSVQGWVSGSIWRYAEYKNGDRELYNLKTDRYQLTNVVNDPANASVVSTLKSRLEALRSK